jgi:hypothetical protein
VDSLVANAPPDTIAAQARWLGLAVHEAEGGPDPEPEVIRALIAGYAQLAAELPETDAGRNAAVRAARLALGLYAATGAAADCRAAQAQIDAFGDRYPEDARADSLAAAGASLPCPP